MKKIVFSFISILCGLSLFAARVDTLAVYSPAMQKQIKVVTILPESALQGKRCPTVYLLHGFGGNHKKWLTIKPELNAIADREEIVFICPDGGKSWYWDSPTNATMRYETFISQELPAYADQNLPVIPHPNARAITGLSMGGHGALWNAMRHPEVFGAAGSTSGGVDIRPFPNNWEMARQLGEKSANESVWDQHTVMTQADSLKNGELALIIDCGYDDFFFEVNEKLHQKLLDRKIAHDYLTRPGAHNATYWNNSIDYQLLFFSKFFRNPR